MLELAGQQALSLTVLIVAFEMVDPLGQVQLNVMLLPTNLTI